MDLGREVLPAENLSGAVFDTEKVKLLDIPSFIEWNSKGFGGPEIFNCIRNLCSRYSKVGAVGYCYGGWERCKF